MANMLDLSMACSDSKIYTTWSNLKHSSINKTMSRHPSGNNNTISNLSQSTGSNTAMRKVKRSQSLPDLAKKQQVDQIVIPLNFSVRTTIFFLHSTVLSKQFYVRKKYCFRLI